MSDRRRNTAVTHRDATAAPDLAEVAGRFGHLLNAADVPVTPERSGRFAAAVEWHCPR